MIFSLFLLFQYIFSKYRDKWTSEQGINYLIETEKVFNLYLVDYFTDIIGFDLSILYEQIYNESLGSLNNLDNFKKTKILEHILKYYFEPTVNNYDILYKFNQNQYDALVSFVFNKGDIDKLTNNGENTIEQIYSFINNNAFTTIEGKKSDDLLSIRTLEKQLFNKPVEINNNLITINKLENNGITPSGPIQFFCSSINGY